MSVFDLRETGCNGNKDHNHSAAVLELHVMTCSRVCEMCGGGERCDASRRRTSPRVEIFAEKW